MEVRQLRSLFVLARVGSLSRAALELHLSPAAIHKQLKTLENELGVSLYQRVGRKVQLTQAGTVLLPFSKSLLTQHDSALAAVEESKGLKTGLVRIGTGPAASSYILPALLRKYRRSYPTMNLVVETGNTTTLLRKLMSGTLDLALTPFLREDRNISVEASWDVEFVLVSNLPHVPHACSLRDLKDFPFLLFQKGSRTQNRIDHYFAEASFEPSVSMRFDNSEAIKAMVVKGAGLAMLPLWVVHADLRKGSLSVVRHSEPPLFFRLALLRRKSEDVPVVVQALIQMARPFVWNNPPLTSQKHKTRAARPPAESGSKDLEGGWESHKADPARRPLGSTLPT